MTRSDIISRIRLEYQESSAEVLTDTSLLLYVQDGLKAISDLRKLKEEGVEVTNYPFDDDYSILVGSGSQSVDMTFGSNTITGLTLPDDFIAKIKLECTNNSDIKLVERNVQDKEQYPVSADSESIWYYDIRDGYIVFDRDIDAGTEFNFRYYKYHEDLTTTITSVHINVERHVQVLADYVLSRWYKLDHDVQNAAAYMQDHKKGLLELHSTLKNKLTAKPVFKQLDKRAYWDKQ